MANGVMNVYTKTPWHPFINPPGWDLLLTKPLVQKNNVLSSPPPIISIYFTVTYAAAARESYFYETKVTLHVMKCLRSNSVSEQFSAQWQIQPLLSPSTFYLPKH